MFRSKTEAAAWLSGIIDGEGHVSRRKASHGARGLVREVRITNTDMAILDAARAALDLLGVEHVTYDRSDRERLGSKPIFDIVISRKANLEHLASQITLHSMKGAQMEEMIGSYLRGNRPSKEDLDALVATGMSDRRIGEKFGVTAGAVWFWRRDYALGKAAAPVGRPKGRKWTPEERAKREAVKVARLASE